MAKQLPTMDIERSSEISSDVISTATSDLSLSTKPRVMKLDLLTLPQFNVTYISRCLKVSERLTILACIHRRFRDFVYQPQCFPDMSFFPKTNAEMYHPKILSSNVSNSGRHGITYVEINIFSKHPFIQRVALLAGMWNFKADCWNQMDWPLNVNIESLQLTLDYTSNLRAIHLDYPPQKELEHLNKASDDEIEPSTNDDEEDNEDDDVEVDRNNEDDQEGEQKQHEVSESTPKVTAQGENAKNLSVSTTAFSNGESLNLGECISPTTRKPMDLKGKLRNLFFIRFDTSSVQPVVYFPSTLWGLGLQSFTSTIFSQNWWTKQVKIEQRFESLRFLVLTCCDFANDELQILLNGSPNVEHLSMRYVRWDGTLYFPKGLLSLGYFPDRHFSGHYSFKKCRNLWQISTRINENHDASIEFLNACSMILSIKRVKIEFIKREYYNQNNIDLQKLRKWEERKDDDSLTVAISKEDLFAYPIIREILCVPEENYVSLDEIKFQDCPLWSDQSFDFIHMTEKRKLLLR